MMQVAGKRVLITGSGGMLGDAICRLFGETCELTATDLLGHAPVVLDVRDRAMVEEMFVSIRPDIVIHLAALIDLEFCETHPNEANQTNAVGAKNVALCCAETDTTMVLVSTAGVFDGELDRYNEYHSAAPLSVYGKSKYAAEQFVIRHVSKHYIARAGWMMGGGPNRDKKFVNKLIGQIRNGAHELKVVDDKLGTPTYTYDFAANLLILLESGQYGLYHMVGEGDGSRYDVAEEILAALGISDEVLLTRVTSSYWQSEYFAPRPHSERLVNLKLNRLGLNRMRHWRECLHDYMAQHSWLETDTEAS